MRLWIISIVVVCTLGFMLSDVGIIESNTITVAPAIQQTPVAKVITKQSRPQANNEGVEQDLSEHMAKVSNQYEQNIRFPHYSTPIDAGQTDLLEPLKVFPVSLTPEKDDDSSAQLSPDSFTYKEGDIIKATFSSSGTIEATKVSIELVESNQKISKFKVKKEGKAYRATLDSTGKDWPVDLHIKASFDFGKHGRLNILSPIKFSPDNGTILSVGDAYVDGANLSIPVQLNIKAVGRYRLSANLFDEAKSPMAHLSAKQNLKQGNNTWILQVHSEVLRATNNPGPYILDTWTLTKLPERPGIRTSYGDSNIQAEKIEGFELNEYDTTPWSDPQDTARLKFLQKL